MRATPDWAAALATRLGGNVDVSPLARRLYSQDASIYEQRPLGVARPRDAADCKEIVRTAAALGFSLIPRAGGTSLAGQCVGPGLVVEVTRHMNRILSIDPAGRTARVEPGVVQDDLNDAAAPHNLMFAPDTSTSKQAGIGGMIGNNSCGAFSVRFGTTRDHVDAVDVVLADGSPARFDPLDGPALEAKRREDSADGRITRSLFDLVERHRALILDRSPKPSVRRRNAGYALDALARGRPWVPDGAPFNLARLLCGSEGTLALVTAADVRLVPRPAARRLVCVHFASVGEACRATVATLAHRPAAVELMDGALLAATRHHPAQAPNRFWIEGEPGGVLAIEMWADDDAAADRAAADLVADLRSRGLGIAHPIVPADRMARVWALRKAGLGLLTGIPGDAKPVTAIEDIAVAPEDLADFVTEIEALMKRLGCSCVYYGHASVGLLHYRPMLNFKKPDDLRTFERLCAEVVSIVRRFGGCLSGEHGDGRLRSPFLREALTPELYDLCAQVKHIFDPHGVLNPGKIVDPAPLTADLRTSPATPTPEVATEFDWSRTVGLVRAAEACNGAGVCRQSAGRGLMCPTYMATGDEAHTTRARANLLRQALTSGDPDAAWSDPELAAAMDTCLSCKGCQPECPSGVDLARMKAEWLQKRNDRRGPSLRSLAMGFYATAARAARIAPDWVSRIANSALSKRLLGIAPQRRVPPYARRTLAQWARTHLPPAGAGARGEVLLFNDEFTNYGEPEIGIAAIEVLELAGWRVRLTHGLESGRTQISKGFLRAARRRIAHAVATLAPEAERGIRILGLEPSAILTFRDEAPDLVPPALRAKALKVAERCLLFDDFIAREADAGTLASLAFGRLPEGEVLFHGHCHQKAIAGTAGTRRALALIPGLRVAELGTACCGMAGSFGYEREHFDLSMKVANQILLPAIRARPDALVCAPGTSCRQQIRDGAGRRAWHPAELLHQSLEAGRDRAGVERQASATAPA
ncbi:MAG: hypothetical protein BWK77_08930 [Verrucomicrobia bacterium A1]|nr:MAG: hypothetical protein BWK77_08930 [Verrucomicrobia bacterium A1]